MGMMQPQIRRGPDSSVGRKRPDPTEDTTMTPSTMMSINLMRTPMLQGMRIITSEMVISRKGMELCRLKPRQ
ncbi:hypothetical protein EYF80_026520 [Liparis tanakae]|uniref:Uncharacterized protein n=1 Tax=Liparis tanakae TaxID=230148 RepID=A0A4Z2HBS4_9TELE|nr:hypothetical protein EYF80_026520 [Liparis tanakae]